MLGEDVRIGTLASGGDLQAGFPGPQRHTGCGTRVVGRVHARVTLVRLAQARGIVDADTRGRQPWLSPDPRVSGNKPSRPGRMFFGM